jgi:hypothetical protein
MQMAAKYITRHGMAEICAARKLLIGCNTERRAMLLLLLLLLMMSGGGWLVVAKKDEDGLI